MKTEIEFYDFNHRHSSICLLYQHDFLMKKWIKIKLFKKSYKNKDLIYFRITQSKSIVSHIILKKNNLNSYTKGYGLTKRIQMKSFIFLSNNIILRRINEMWKIPKVSCAMNSNWENLIYKWIKWDDVLLFAYISSIWNK